MNTDFLKKWLDKETLFPHKGDEVLFQLLHDPRFGLDSLYIQQKCMELYQKNRGKGAGKHSLRNLIATELEPIPTLFDTNAPHPIHSVSRKLEKALSSWKNLDTADRSHLLSDFWKDFPPLPPHTIVEASTKPRIRLISDQLLSPLLERYSLSVSHLNSFLHCPLKFYYQNLIRVPAAGNESMSFGVAVHSALEQLFLQMKNNQGVFPPAENFINGFLQSMEASANEFERDSFQKKLTYGQQILTTYYQKHQPFWNKIVIVEKNIRTKTKEGIPINGIMDKLEFNGKDITIIDYKTGNHAKALGQLSPPSSSQITGGDYWRQAIFYKILIDEDPGNNWNTTQVVFDFIEPVNGEYKKENVLTDPASTATVHHQIRSVWKQIQEKAFDTGCGKPQCHWCNFVQTHHLNISISA